MRKLVVRLMPLIIAGTAPSAFAQDISPGRWELSLETRVAATPGFSPEPFKLTQCLTAADAKDPSRLLGQMSSPGASDCKYSDKRYSGNTFSFSMTCAGAFAIQSRGEVRYTSDTMDGNITAKANVNGNPVEFQNKVSGRRIGGC